MKAIVESIQVGGLKVCSSFQEACKWWVENKPTRKKMNFAIILPSGERRAITIRDEDGETVAYGDFEGLPSFLDYAEEVMSHKDKS